MIKIEKNCGITLISLVVTIVVLLILAGVTISILFGENSIIIMAQKAKEEMEESANREMAELFVNSINMELLTNNSIREGYNNIEDFRTVFGEKAPNIGWIYVENRKVTKYEFYYDNFFILYVNGRLRTEKFDYSNLINVKDYGVMGDGITDDTLAIQSIIKSLNENGGTIYFPTGTYLISASQPKDSIIDLNSDKNICIDFFGSTLKLSPNSYTAYNVVKTTNCSNVEVRNGILIGDRLLHDYDTISDTHEFGYGIYFTLSQYCMAYNMDISDMTGDAIINKNGESGGTTIVSNSNLHHCRRQGISILDSDIVEVEHTNIYNIGTWDNIEGTSPMTGIDIEPASGTMTINSILIDDVTIKDTSSFGIINIRKNLGEIKILNSTIYSPNLTNANIKDSSMFFDLNKGLVMRDSNIENSYMKINCAGATLNIPGSTINNSTIEGPEDIIGGRVLAENSKIIQTSFKKLRGTGNYSSNSQTDFGIIFRQSYNYLDGSRNNTYDECAILMALEVNDEDSIINNSYIYIDSIPTILNNFKINNCETNSNPVGNLTLKNCEVNNSGHFGKCKKYLYDTHLSIQDCLAGAFPDGSTCNNSTIQIVNTMPKTALENIAFSNNSKIILEKYNANNKIVNSYSTEGIDYTAVYNGTETLY